MLFFKISPIFLFLIINVLLKIIVIFLLIILFMIHCNRLEAIDVKSPRGLAKIVGTVLSLTGALIMILYKGHTIQSLKGAPFHLGGKMAHNNWIKGTILTVVSCISWSLWYILQVYSSIIKYTYTFYFLFLGVTMKNLGPD